MMEFGVVLWDYKEQRLLSDILNFLAEL